MKSIGVVRKVDELGRIVLPMKLRRDFDIQIKDSIEILVDRDTIVLRKYQPQKACLITGEITPENKSFGDENLILSPKGMELLRNELRSFLTTK